MLAALQTLPLRDIPELLRAFPQVLESALHGCASALHGCPSRLYTGVSGLSKFCSLLGGRRSQVLSLSVEEQVLRVWDELAALGLDDSEIAAMVCASNADAHSSLTHTSLTQTPLH
jgi:hypothetical protein